MSKLQRVSQAERTEISDTRMLDTAIQLIVERGVENTTLKDVGELAGYSRGLVGYRFGNKAGLFTFVLQQVGKQWLEAFTQVVGDAVGQEAIAASIEAHNDFCIEMPDHFKAFYILWFESIGPKSELKEVVASIHSRRCEDVARWIQGGLDNGSVNASVDPNKVAIEFCSSVIGIVYHWLLNPESTTIALLYSGLEADMYRRLSL